MTKPDARTNLREIGRTALRAAVRLARVAGVLAIAASVAGWLARLHWLLELASHFRFQYLLVLTLAVLVLAVARWWRQTALFALVAVVQAVPLWPLYFDRPNPAPVGVRTYRAVSLNVMATNGRYDDVVAFLRRESPDFVVMVEVTQAWADVISQLRHEYPYAEIDARPSNFGIALLSRLEPERIELFQVGRGYRSAIVGRFVIEGRTLSVVGAHPYPPRGAVEAEIRSQQLEEVANVVNWQDGDVLLLGDLNTTGWSPRFADLVDATGLRDTRRGFGRLPTWPSVMPACLRITIDHALVSPGLYVHDRRVGPQLGSDHLPIVVDFSFDGTAKTPVRDRRGRRFPVYRRGR